MTVVAFDPTKHPRHPKGSAQGGEFRDREGNVQPIRSFPPGEFDPDGSVKFWPDRIGRGLPIGRGSGGAAWKAWMDPGTGKELAFWFVNRNGAPHHLDMAHALGIAPPKMDETLVGPLRVSGFGTSTDMGWMASYFANDLGVQKDEMQRLEGTGNKLHSLIMGSVEEIAKRHRKDIKDANLMSVSPAMAASALDGEELLRAVERLRRQYEKVYRRAAKRAAADYKDASKVVLAAGGPLPEEVIKAAALIESFLRLTGVARRELLKEILNALLLIYGLDADERAAEIKAIQRYADLLEQQVGVQAERLVAGVQDAAADVMLTSLHEGWSVPQTAKALQEKIEGIAPWQSTMLARTDLIALGNGASLRRAVTVDSPDLQYKTWLATPDERTRVDHRHAHGQTVPIVQPFTVGGEQLLYPGDPSASDGNVINCRCTVIYGRDAFGPPGIKQVVMRGDLSLSAAGWDESKHPRNPKGTTRGGEFRGKALLDEIDRQRKKRAEQANRTEPEYSEQFQGMWSPDADEYIFDPDDPYFSDPVWKAIWRTDGSWKYWVTNRQGMPFHEQVSRRLGIGIDDVQGQFSGNRWGVADQRQPPPELMEVLQRNRSRYMDAASRSSSAYRSLAADGWMEVELRDGDVIGILTAAGWDPAKHPRHPAGSPEGGEFAPKGFYHGAMIARDPDDKAIGYQAFRMDLDIPGKHKGRTLAGPVRETYQEAAEDARQAQDAEVGAENAAGAQVDWSEAEKEFRNWSEGLRSYYTEAEGYPPGYFEKLQKDAWWTYQDWVDRELPKLQARLNGAQVPGLKITPQLNPQTDGDMDVALDPERAADSGPDFEVTLPAAEGGMEPSFTVWTYPEGANKRHETDPDWFEQPEGVQVEEVLDITDTDFFPDGPDSNLAGDYARAVDAARGVPSEPGFVTIYRGMSDAEYDSWLEGNEIPTGKWFAGIPTAQYAQDINREPPTLRSFRVPKHMLMQTAEHEFQLKKKGRMRNGTIEPADTVRASGLEAALNTLTEELRAAGFIEAQHPRHPKGSERGGEFAPKGAMQVGETRSLRDKLIPPAEQHLALDAIELIDKTLAYPAVPGEPDLKIIVSGDPTKPSRQAAYWRYDETRKPDMIMVDPDGVNPVSSLTHELGHYLDHLLGQDAWADPKYADAAQGRDVWFDFASKDTYGPLAPVLTSIKETDMYRSLADGAQGAEFSYGGRYYRPGPRHVQYLMKPEELVARSFEQYIAAKNPGSTLARTTRHAFSQEPGLFPPEYPGFLKGQDLERVNAAWDRVLADRGLLKAPPGTVKPRISPAAAETYHERQRKLRAMQTS